MSHFPDLTSYNHKIYSVLLQGPAGLSGPPGAQGDRGLVGLPGMRGETGAAGPVGPSVSGYDYW